MFKCVIQMKKLNSKLDFNDLLIPGIPNL